MQALVELFYRCEESARQQEAHTDDLIDNDLSEKAQKEDDRKDDELEETVAKCELERPFYSFGFVCLKACLICLLSVIVLVLPQDRRACTRFLTCWIYVLYCLQVAQNPGIRFT